MKLSEDKREDISIAWEVFSIMGITFGLCLFILGVPLLGALYALIISTGVAIVTTLIIIVYPYKK